MKEYSWILAAYARLSRVTHVVWVKQLDGLDKTPEAYSLNSKPRLSRLARANVNSALLLIGIATLRTSGPSVWRMKLRSNPQNAQALRILATVELKRENTEKPYRYCSVAIAIRTDLSIAQLDLADFDPTEEIPPSSKGAAARGAA